MRARYNLTLMYCVQSGAWRQLVGLGNGPPVTYLKGRGWGWERKQLGPDICAHCNRSENDILILYYQPNLSSHSFSSTQKVGHYRAPNAPIYVWEWYNSKQRWARDVKVRDRDETEKRRL